MNRLIPSILQAAIVLLGVGALAFLLGEPHLEGRNAGATAYQIYFQDPFLAYAYLGSLPFFMALHRAYGLFGNLKLDPAFSRKTLDSLRAIRLCALAFLAFVAAGVVFIVLFGDKEDRPAGIFMSLLVILPTSLGILATVIFGRLVQRHLQPPDVAPHSLT